MTYLRRDTETLEVPMQLHSIIRLGKRGPLPRSPTERYWVKVVKGENPDDCWGWDGPKHRGGYGYITIGSTADGSRRHIMAHRVSFLIHHGELPDGLPFVLHRCDNPPCSNPAHLFAGTDQDNVHDMASKGRHAKQRITHCPKGHPYDKSNTRVKQGRRYCRICLVAQRRSPSTVAHRRGRNGPVGVQDHD